MRPAAAERLNIADFLGSDDLGSSCSARFHPPRSSLLRERPFAGRIGAWHEWIFARLHRLNVNEKSRRSEIGLWIEANRPDNAPLFRG
jgi:hypothetical protein